MQGVNQSQNHAHPDHNMNHVPQANVQREPRDQNQADGGSQKSSGYHGFMAYSKYWSLIAEIGSQKT